MSQIARYVLLAFDSNKEADDFVAAVEANKTDQAQIFFATPDSDEVQDFKIHALSETTFVRGVYFRPTQFCTCGPGGGFTRGKKFGMWVHSKCGLPTKAWAAGDHWYASVGRNLLPPSPQAPEWRGDGIAHHKFNPETKQYEHVETGKVWDGTGSNQTT